MCTEDRWSKYEHHWMLAQCMQNVDLNMDTSGCKSNVQIHYVSIYIATKMQVTLNVREAISGSFSWILLVGIYKVNTAVLNDTFHPYAAMCFINITDLQGAITTEAT